MHTYVHTCIQSDPARYFGLSRRCFFDIPGPYGTNAAVPVGSSLSITGMVLSAPLSKPHPEEFGLDALMELQMQGGDIPDALT